MKTPDCAYSTFFGMNTVISHTVYGRHADKAAAAAQRETQRLEGLFSRFLPDSDIARLNAGAGGDSVKVSPDTLNALRIGQECARNTGGCFDMTVGPLVRLWHTGIPPSQDVLNAAREMTGYQTLHISKHGGTVSLQKRGQSVDLGGIGKGYAADRMIEGFRKCRIASAFTDFGGNIAVLGTKPDGSPWKVGIRHPLCQNALIGTLSVVNQSVVTSGNDQRAVDGADGLRRSHIIDPRTGIPADTGLQSVTVVAASSAVADALATALFTAGIRDGMRYLARFPGADAVFVNKDLTVFYTNGLLGGFQAAEGIQAHLLWEEYS